ncbi:MAG: hypothetical protein K6T31_04290, partial [Alicyclobacillus sp.]|nr:hypothetical protein [Alicyclobacillus sp.]
RLQDWQRQTGSGVLLITHDLAVVAAVADVVAVMYAGQLVEWAAVEQLWAAPQHPYTQALWEAAACLYGGAVPTDPRPALTAAGEAAAAVPTTAQAAAPAAAQVGAAVADGAAVLDSGCRYVPRCPHALPRCLGQPPPWREVQRGHWVRCTLV